MGSRLVESELRACRQVWKDYGRPLRSNPVTRATRKSALARTKWQWIILPWMVARNERSSRMTSWQNARFEPGFLIFLPKP